MTATWQGKLGLDRGVRLENLTVSHFLSALDRLADPALLQFVKHLQSRAQGEVRLFYLKFLCHLLCVTFACCDELKIDSEVHREGVGTESYDMIAPLFCTILLGIGNLRRAAVLGVPTPS